MVFPPTLGWLNITFLASRIRGKGKDPAAFLRLKINRTGSAFLRSRIAGPNSLKTADKRHGGVGRRHADVTNS